MMSIRSVGLNVCVAVGLSMSLAATNLAAAATAATPAKKTADNALQRLNVAEQQEMLAERLSRTWAMKGIASLRSRSSSQFDEDSRRYVKQLKSLQADADTPQLKENYAQLEQLWSKYLEAAEASAVQLQVRSGDSRGELGSELPPTAFVGSTQGNAPRQPEKLNMPDTVKAIADQSDKLVATAAKGSDLLRQRIGAEPSEGLRLAGQARTLSQRMAKLYFFKALGVSAPSLTADMKKTQEAYLASIKRVRELSEDRPKSSSALFLVDQQWVFFNEILQRNVEREERDQVYQTFARTSDSLLSGLDDLCKTFEQPAPAP
ncbi:hypothetical protein VVD49_16745 [Uliginosibacterium sp. H3]|uniref:Type IV pili methyl-accepting chemotaxis transducer N-term n=1 Tax=Uliginosibacterium silvisoli TaxID=3114758 RepID=A0ABU6K7Z2_9RHOO|nr:hypothetical protein [Uliginosibacterium sp. H3]